MPDLFWLANSSVLLYYGIIISEGGLIMKYAMTLIVLVLAGFGPFFLHTNVSQANEACFTVIDSQWGKGCNEDDPNSLQLTVKNTCDKKMTLLYCMDRGANRKHCQVKENMEAKASLVISACNASGSYEFIGCERARDCKKELEKIMGK